MAKLTKDQKKKQKEIMQDFNDQLGAAEGNEAIELQTAKKAPEMMWACTPEIKLKANQPEFDLQLTPEQTRGGVIRIIRTGSNKIKICSMVLKKHLDDGYAQAKKEAKKNKAKGKESKVDPNKRKFVVRDLPPKKGK